MKTKINIGIALSRNYDKISLDLVEELIEHKDEEELRKIIRTKLKMLREEIEREFGVEEKPQTPTESTPKPIEKASEKQKSYLSSLGFKGDINLLTKVEATQLIKEILEQPQDY